jgi:hypothetical protein
VSKRRGEIREGEREFSSGTPCSSARASATRRTTLSAGAFSTTGNLYAPVFALSYPPLTSGPTQDAVSHFYNYGVYATDQIAQQG